MTDITLRPFAPDDMPEAARVLAQAFVTNPINMATLGEGALARNEVFFEAGLPMMQGAKWVAVADARIVGFVRWVDWPGCQATGADKLRLMPAMTRRFGVASAFRIASWLRAWEKRDPPRPHAHLGPIGVLPDMQSRHVGSRLMERYCETLDRLGQAGYLETDRPRNVDFYRRFGFETTEEATVVGVRNYFMWREARRP